MRLLTALARLVRAGLALTVLAGFTAGVPWLLTLAAGWPLQWLGWTHPASLPSPADLTTAITSPWSDEMVLALLATCGWILWGLFVRDVIAEVLATFADAAAIRAGRPRISVSKRGPLRWVAAMLVGAILSAVLLDAARAGLGAHTVAAQAAANTAAHRQAVAVAPAKPAAANINLTVDVRPASGSATRLTPMALTIHPSQDRIPAWAANAPDGVHHVVKGDNLWDIAEAKLGDPYRWREIYLLNRGKPQHNGYALTDPDLIDIGWVLALPARNPAPVAPAPTEPPAVELTPTPPSDATNTSPGSSTSTNPSRSLSTAPSEAPTIGASSSPTTGATKPTPETTTAPTTSDERHNQHARGVSLPSQGWISLGLATSIATVAALLRLHARRRARLGHPIPVSTNPHPSPVPAELAAADIAGRRRLEPDSGEHTPPTPIPLEVPAPIGIDEGGAEVSLFTLPGPGIALLGDGAEPVARGILAAALATGVLEAADARPVVVTTPAALARLVPDGDPLVGLDPEGTSFDGERLIVLPDTAAAVTHAEEEMITRRRLLDSIDADTVADLNARADLAEHQPPYVLLIDATTRHARRITAIGAHRHALDLHPVLLGEQDDVPSLDVRADGTPISTDTRLRRLATLSASDLAGILAMVAATLPRPEPGTDIDEPSPAPATPQPVELPTPSGDTPAPVLLRVLGPITVTTEAGPVTTGMRSGSYAVLAVLAAHPAGRTLEQIAAGLHPDTDSETAAKRVRTDITTARRVLRAATNDPDAKFIIYDERYRLDPDTIGVDLWQMLAAIARANTTADDTMCLAALREAAELYRGDFAENFDRAWAVDYATSYRHQILGVYARIAELLEADQPDQAIAALETAIGLDTVNEELYQRVMRIHGRLHRPDAVRRTLRQLETRLAELDAEPSEATRRVAERQLHPAPVGGRR